MFGNQNLADKFKHSGNGHNNLYKYYLWTSQRRGNGFGFWWHFSLYLCLEQRTNHC